MSRKLLAFLKRELLEMLPPTLYFFVVFHIVAFTRALMEHQYGITIASTTTATIGAIIVGKSILIADALPIMRWFSRTRLIYNVLWRIVLYIVLILLIQSLEGYIPMISKYGGLVPAAKHFISEIIWYRFWAVHILLVGFLIIYSLATSVIDEFGRDKMLHIFFGIRNKA